MAKLIQELYQTSGDKYKLVKAAEQYHERYFQAVDYTSGQDLAVNKLVFDRQDDTKLFYQITSLNYNLGRLDEVKWAENGSETAQHIISNYEYITQLVREYLEQSQINLNDLINSILNRNLLVKFVAKDESIARDMFESLNNTGKNLEKYYVLKNDIVSALGEEEVRDAWQEIDTNLGGINKNDFLKSVSKLLDLVKKGNKSKDPLIYIYKKYDKNSISDMRSLLDLLKRASEKYLGILQPQQLSNRQDKATKNYRKISVDTGKFITKQHYPVIMAMMLKNYSLEEVNYVLKKTLVLAVRNFFIAENRANTIENDYSKLAYEIYSNNISTEKIIESIESLTMTDREVRDKLLGRAFKQKQMRKVAFLLREIFNVELEKDGVQVQYSENDLEHILPINPSPESKWMQIFNDNDERQLLTWNIGNMTLLPKGKNRSLGNNEFEEKKKVYQESPLPDHQKIAKNLEWTADLIKKRSNELSSLIIKKFK